jgi:hypothetical protein
MKLSHAILMNGMMKPQGFGFRSIHSMDAPCAIGGALQAVGIDTSKECLVYNAFEKIWPWVNKNEASCPVCNAASGLIKPYQIIFHLNDTHEWTRTQIAEWVASVEPAGCPEMDSTEATISELETSLSS